MFWIFFLREPKNSDQLVNGTTLHEDSSEKCVANQATQVLNGGGEKDSGKPGGRGTKAGDANQVGSFLFCPDL